MVQEANVVMRFRCSSKLRSMQMNKVTTDRMQI